MRRNGAIGIAMSAAILSLGVAGAALAATGDLSFAQCFDDEDTDPEGTACANVPGLQFAASVAASADGKSLYVAGRSNHAVVNFNRDPNTGALFFAQCFDDADISPEGPACADTLGLEGARSVATSADGRSVYVASQSDSAVVNFNRDPNTGVLSFSQCFDDEDTNSEGTDCTSTPGLGSASSVAPSADGRSLYVTSQGDDAVVHFNRDANTGVLSAPQCFDDEDTDTEATSCTNVPGLENAFSVAPSADGRSLYVASQTDAAVVNFTRHPDTGALSFSQCFDDEDEDLEGTTCTNAPGLDGARSVATSADGRSLYVASSNDDAVVNFNRDPDTGALFFSQCFEDEDEDLEGTTCANVPGVRGAFSVAPSADGRSLYVAASADFAVANFNRDPSTGALFFSQCFDDEDSDREGASCINALGLGSALSVAPSADGRSLYVASELDDAVVRFDREPEPPADDGGGSKGERTLTLDANKRKVKKGKKVRLSGQLEATGNDAACEASQAIEISRTRLNGGHSKVVATPATDAQGNYANKVKVKKSSLYMASTAETAACEAETSDTEKVRVKKPKAAKEA